MTLIRFSELISVNVTVQGKSKLNSPLLSLVKLGLVMEEVIA